MLYNTQRPPSLVDVCDFNTLHLREHNASINTKNYLSSQPPPPMSYRDLRLVVTNRIPSNIVILPKSSSPPSSIISNDTLIIPRRKKEPKKLSKQTGVDVYRSLLRSISHCSIASERDMTNDEINRLTNSITVDRISLLPSTGFFHPHNLPKIQKPSIKQKPNLKPNTNSKLFPLSSNIDYSRATTPHMYHPTTPTNAYYEENNNRMTMTTTTTTTLPHVPKNQSRKQLHVYIPQITC